MKLADLSGKQEEIKEQLKYFAQKEVTPALKEAFREIKDKNPKLVSIRWYQYTPYFNDGDVCVFGIRGVYFKLNDDDDDGEEEYGGFDRVLEGVEDLLKIAFGDHAQVTLTENSIEVEEYEHD